MAKLSIVSVQHEAGMEGLRGQGVPVGSKVALKKGQIVTAGGDLASAVDATKPAFGYVGWDTGDKMGAVVPNQIFRAVREAWVQMDTPKTPGTKIYLSDTAGELADAKGTTEVCVGYYIAEPENGANPATGTSTMAILDFKVY